MKLCKLFQEFQETTVIPKFQETTPYKKSRTKSCEMCPLPRKLQYIRAICKKCLLTLVRPSYRYAVYFNMYIKTFIKRQSREQ